MAGLIGELGLTRPVIVGYDIGSRIAQTLAAEHPDLVRALVISPPVPGIGDRILSPDAQREFWYQQFHRLDLATELIDGDPGRGARLSPALLGALVAGRTSSSRPSISTTWSRRTRRRGVRARLLAGTGPGPDLWPDPSRNSRPRRRTGSPTPTTVLWPGHDPLFPPEWSDRIDEFFADARLIHLPGAGHFTPLERPAEFAAAITAAHLTPAQA